VAQSVKRPTLDLSSGLDLRVVSSSPSLGFMLGLEHTYIHKNKVEQTGAQCLLTTCVTSTKSLNFSEPHFAHLKDEGIGYLKIVVRIRDYNKVPSL